MRALIDGIEAANLKRKHMRPYYENMKRAYLRTQQFRRRKKKNESAE